MRDPEKNTTSEQIVSLTRAPFPYYYYRYHFNIISKKKHIFLNWLTNQWSGCLNKQLQYTICMKQSFCKKENTIAKV